MAFSDFRIMDIRQALGQAREEQDTQKKLDAVIEAVQAVLAYVEEKKREDESAMRNLQRNLGSSMF